MKLTDALEQLRNDNHGVKPKLIDHARLKGEVLFLITEHTTTVPDFGTQVTWRWSIFEGDHRGNSGILRTLTHSRRT